MKRILVALDGSPRAPHVVDAAAELARQFRAELVPVRATFIPAEFPPAAHVVHRDSLPAYIRWEATQEMNVLLARDPGARATTPIIRHGRPWEVILDVAREEQADLIVLGSHGYHGLDMFLGTTAARVVNLAPCSVFVVHDIPFTNEPQVET